MIVIQKYFRRWLAMRTVEKVRDDMAARLEWEREDEIRKRKEKEDRIRREFERRMNPKSREDFDLLYHALESKKLIDSPKEAVFTKIIRTTYMFLFPVFFFFFQNGEKKSWIV